MPDDYTTTAHRSPTCSLDAIKTTQIPDDYKLVSFDVKSLSTPATSMPLQLERTERTAIRQSTVTLPLPTEDIINLLNLCLTSTYFQYNGKHYKQTEHKRATRNGDVNNHIAEHHRLTNQTIDCTMFNLQPTNYFQRLWKAGLLT